MNPRQEIINFCDDLKEKLLAKWDAGAKEHGDDWQGVDCQKEMLAEVFDLINYAMIERCQNEKLSSR